ncbi:MAG: hypothetical protein AB7N80_14815 [Bdellovibrionales bacterium]
MKNKFLLLLAILISPAAWSFETGTFKTRDCENEEGFHLKEWNGDYLFHQRLSYKDNLGFEVDVVMAPRGHILRGQGNFVVSYYRGQVMCTYPYRVELRWDQTKAEYFLQLWYPTHIPQSPDGKCPRVQIKNRIVSEPLVNTRRIVCRKPEPPRAPPEFDWGNY